MHVRTPICTLTRENASPARAGTIKFRAKVGQPRPACSAEIGALLVQRHAELVARGPARRDTFLRRVQAFRGSDSERKRGRRRAWRTGLRLGNRCKPTTKGPGSGGWWRESDDSMREPCHSRSAAEAGTPYHESAILRDKGGDLNNADTSRNILMGPVGRCWPNT